MAVNFVFTIDMIKKEHISFKILGDKRSTKKILNKI